MGYDGADNGTSELFRNWQNVNHYINQMAGELFRSCSLDQLAIQWSKRNNEKTKKRTQNEQCSRSKSVELCSRVTRITHALRVTFVALGQGIGSLHDQYLTVFKFSNSSVRRTMKSLLTATIHCQANNNRGWSNRINQQGAGWSLRACMAKFLLILNDVNQQENL